MATDATWAMCIECSYPPTKRGVKCTTLVGVTATCVGNSRFPRLKRLARKTCGPGSLRPLAQKKASTTAATSAPASKRSPST